MALLSQPIVEHIHGDVQATNVTEATTPLDDASCCASSYKAELIALFEKTIKWIDEDMIPKLTKLNWTEQIQRYEKIKEQTLIDLSRISSM